MLTDMVVMEVTGMVATDTEVTGMVVTDMVVTDTVVTDMVVTDTMDKLTDLRPYAYPPIPNCL